ncbi:MAG: AraC family transcriptional regulator [Gammaproteobacteria bacterium]|nr:MAG: AraC family transcriptional regulator [Gammaproteobacteria bacterium]
MVTARRNDRVAVVVYDGLTTLEYAIPIEIFGLPRPEIAHYYDTVTVAAEPGRLAGSHGLRIQAEADLSALAVAGTIVIPGWRDRFERPPEPLLEALCSAREQGARLVSICAGSFVLAATGLLDGRRATTHWLYADDLRDAYPFVVVDESSLYVDEGALLTGAGSAAGIDACLYLVRNDFGSDVANKVARRMVVSPQREGGQAQFIPEPVAERHGSGDRSVAALMDALLATLDESHSVESMAGQMCVSPRTLFRRFRAAVGIGPAEWLALQRIRRACTLLETTDLGIDAIAAAVGFGSTVGFRQQFQHRMQLPPGVYRRRFRVG